MLVFPIGSFLGGIIVQYSGASLAILLQGLAEALTAIFYGCIIFPVDGYR